MASSGHYLTPRYRTASHGGAYASMVTPHTSFDCQVTLSDSQLVASIGETLQDLQVRPPEQKLGIFLPLLTSYTLLLCRVPRRKPWTVAACSSSRTWARSRTSASSRLARWSSTRPLLPGRGPSPFLSVFSSCRGKGRRHQFDTSCRGAFGRSRTDEEGTLGQTTSSARIVREVRSLPMWNFNGNFSPELRGRNQVIRSFVLACLFFEVEGGTNAVPTCNHPGTNQHELQQCAVRPALCA